MDKIFKSIIGMFLFAVVSAQAAPHSEHLARFNISDFGETEYAPVFSCSGERDRVSHLKFRVTRDPARIDSVVVWFGNGTKQRLNMRNFFAENSESRWINLPGDARCIKYIKIKGEAVGAAAGRSSRVDVYGFVTN